MFWNDDTKILLHIWSLLVASEKVSFEERYIHERYPPIRLFWTGTNKVQFSFLYILFAW